LSQWRNYANGSGFAVGFTHSDLKHVAQRFGGNLTQIEYIPAEPPAGNELLRGSTFRAGGESARISVEGSLLAKYKHDAFREEHEWRVIVPSRTRAHSDNGQLPQVKFRRGQLGLTPYIAGG